MRINQAVILAGGKGERLRPLTNKIPKPFAPVNNRPFMDYLIKSLVDVKINHVLILTGYKAEVIEERYANMKGINIDFHRGKVSDQTGTRLINAFTLLDEYFLLLYGDNYWPIELNEMIKLYNKSNVAVSTTVFSNKNGTGEYGKDNNVVIGNDGLVINYDKQRLTKEANGVDIGYFIVRKNILKGIKLNNPSFEVDILPRLIVEKNLAAYVTGNQYYFITDKSSLNNFSEVVQHKNIEPLGKKYFS